jgi:hypothetical protein
MSTIVQAILTTIGNYAGYAVASLLLIAIFRTRNPTVAQIGTALWVLGILWFMVVGWFVASEFWIDTFPPHQAPTWLEASNSVAENNQSEVFQVWLATMLYKYCRAPGSPESKD